MQTATPLVSVCGEGRVRSGYMLTFKGATATRVELPASEKGSAETAWFSPIVDARKGVLKTSAGRMTMSNGDDHDKYGDDPYENYGQ